MIDNPELVKTLMAKMETHLPIPAQATNVLVRNLRDGTGKVSSKQLLWIDSVLYMGDTGGIGCAVKLPGSATQVLVTSLTHLRIPSAHPLSKDIRAYQTARTKILAEA